MAEIDKERNFSAATPAIPFERCNDRVSGAMRERRYLRWMSN
jgi:hypothetical protein